ncbi:MAG: endonuclease domain-containing protein [Oscillospiraceae bacterium]|nr:endonuclease domain-containing protein [Oscillospiraceae bacterium]
MERSAKKELLLTAAKTLRRNMTKQERHLWYDFLRKYPVKVYRQRIIDRFIADFYCYQARLVIELDGSQHYTDEGIAHDEERTAIMGHDGISVLRFSNRDVDENFEGVCLTIDKTIKDRLRSLP